MSNPLRFDHIGSADEQTICSFYESVFAASEGLGEGALIGGLVEELIKTTNKQDMHGYVALKEDELAGCIIFSRLIFESNIQAFILSPVAVHSRYQGQGIGQALIQYGIEQLRAKGVELLMTYGDPNFYSKVGFLPVSVDTIGPPFSLSQPNGWIGQSLTGDLIEPQSGKAACVAALCKAVYW